MGCSLKQRIGEFRVKLLSQGWARLLTGWMTLFLIGTDLFVISPLLPFIAADEKVTASTAGWMVTVFSLTYAVCAPVFGRLSEYKGRRFFIVLGLILFSVSNIMTAVSPWFAWLIASRVLAGISVASVTPLIYAIIGDVAPVKRRGVWLSIVISGHLSALCLGAPIGAVLEQLLGWRSVFLLLAAFSVVFAVVNGVVWKSIVKVSTISKRPEGRELSSILTAVCVTTLWAIAMYAVYVYLGTGLYVENHFLSPKIAWAVSAYGIGAVVGSLSSGWLTDKFGSTCVSHVSLLFLVAVLIGLGLLFTQPWVYILLCLWAFVGYAGFTSYQARLADEFPSMRGIVMAWNNTALYVGITFGSIMGGSVMGGWGYAALPYICSGVALMSFGLSIRRRTVNGLGDPQDERIAEG
jgi:predicted MFS family arabinose efflux permease